MCSLKGSARRHKAGWSGLAASALTALVLIASGSAVEAAPLLHQGSGGHGSRGNGTIATKSGPSKHARVRHITTSAPADASGALSTVSSVTVHGGYTAAGIGMRNLGRGTISVTGVPTGATVKSATLLWDILADQTGPKFAQGTFNGNPITGTEWASGASPCWQVSSNFSYEADVTSRVNGNGSYALAGFAGGESDGADPWNVGSTPPLLEGASLVVVYTLPSMPETNIQIAEGAAETQSGNTASATLSGFTASTVPSAKTTYIVADGQEAGSTAAFNGTTLPGVGFPGADPQAVPNYSQGNLWDTVTSDVTSLVHPGDSSATPAVTGYDDCLVWVGQVLAVSTGIGPLAIDTTSLPAATVGSPYQTSLVASGGAPPYTWAITQGRLPSGTGGTPWSLDPTSGKISGTPTYAGTTTFTVTVTDSSAGSSRVSRTFSVVVEPSRPLQQFQLCLFTRCPATDQSDSPHAVVTNPHVAFVLVGNWWCDLVSRAQDSNCKFPNYPFKCPGNQGNSCLVEGTQFLGSLNDLAMKDYSDANPGGYDSGLSQLYDVTGCGFFGGCTKNSIGPGLITRFYGGGSFFAGPVTPAQVTPAHVQGTLNGLAGGFGIQSQADADNTVFVLLRAPNLLSCPNPSVNGQTGPGRPGEFGDIVFADVYLEDAQNSCAGDFNQSANPTTTISPDNFATFAVSHEIDEAITDPGRTTRGWFIYPDMQIADPCHTRNADGETSYKSYPFVNFTRDSRGTVVSAYVSPVTSGCWPSVETSIPPG